MDIAVEIGTYIATLGVGYLLGFIVGIQKRRAKVLADILNASLHSPVTRDVRLGKIKKIGDEGVGIIRLDHPADTENFEIGDYIRAMSGTHERMAIAVVVARDRFKSTIQVAVHHHPMNKIGTAKPTNPYDWQPGDVLMPFNPVV